MSRLLIAQHDPRAAGEGRVSGAGDDCLPKKADVDAAYLLILYDCWSAARIPPSPPTTRRIITDGDPLRRGAKIPRARFEFQMLYGIRRDLQERLAGEGYNVRIYIPFGSQWYPYLTRRMAERPANLMFIVSNTLRG